MARSGGKWLVEIHESIDHLEVEWSELANRRNATPFQSHGFMRLLFRQLTVKGIATPVIALVRSQEGRPVALFPMMRSRRHGLRWLLTEARPVDYCSPVFDASLTADDLREIIRAVLAAVPRVDLLYCNRLPDRFGDRPNPFVHLPNAARLRLSAWILTWPVAALTMSSRLAMLIFAPISAAERKSSPRRTSENSLWPWVEKSMKPTSQPFRN